MCARTLRGAGAAFLLLVTVSHAFGAGAIAHKSGAIQSTTDGAFVWAVNPDHNSVSRLATADNSVTEFPLPSGGPHRPRGLALTPDDAHVWIADEEGDRLVVLNAADGTVTGVVGLPYGSAPLSVAISADGVQALVPLFRRGAVAFIDVASRTVIRIIDGVPAQPFAACFVSAPNRACVAHQFNDGENAYITVLNTLAHTVVAIVRVPSVGPKFQLELNGDPVEIERIPEGGYLFPTAHVVERPGAGTLWMPVQYQNFDVEPAAFTPNNCIQSAVHRLNLTTQLVNLEDRVVLTAVYAHSNFGTYIGNGWNAGVSGPIDLAFDAAGTTAYIVHQYSNDVLICPATATPERPLAGPPLVEIPVGDQPIGIALSPVTDRAYVLNLLSRDISVLDLTAQAELLRVPTTPASPEPLDPEILLGNRLFNTSADPRISGNNKISCASCHPGGESDGMPWNNAQFGNGTRKTLHLRGQALSFGPPVGGRGQLHRSGDRDEVQDFDLTFGGSLMGGTGFLAPPNPALGAANAGLNADLDAIAAYVLDLPALARSPGRNADGSLPEAAIRGAALFEAAPASPAFVGCRTCHPAPTFTDLDFHDVGGFAPAPENEGPAFNTPSLVSAWAHFPFRQVLGGDDNTRQSGTALIEVVNRAVDGVHGDTAALSRTQRRDLAAFLDALDGDLAASGIGALADTRGPRVLAVYPLSLSTVEIVFDETLDAASANDPLNYVFDDGQSAVSATAAVLDAALGNHVRVTVALHYYGCDRTYTFRPGPIEDVAGVVSGGLNNVLDINDPENQPAFTLNGTLTVTFGDTGPETFASVSRDASFQHNSASLSHTHVRVFPTSPRTKGFVAFDCVPLLAGACGISSGNQIVDARFSGRPDLGQGNTLEIRRVFKPWGDPPQDSCSSCPGSVTRAFATLPSIPWSANGASAVGGLGTSPGEYYPTASFDVAAAVDATVIVSALDQRVEFAGPGVTSAFRFWFDNPATNFGHAVELVGNINGSGLEFWADEADDGRKGWVLSITYLLAPETTFPDCNHNGVADECDIAGGTPDANGNGIPDPCETEYPRGDVNCDLVVDFFDIDPFLTALFDPSGFAQQFPDCDIDQADINDDLVVDFFDIDPFLECLFSTCP